MATTEYTQLNLLFEEWRSIPNYEGLYEISNFGHVKSLPKVIPLPFGGVRITNKKILKPGFNPYPYVVLCKNGIKNQRLVHRLVLEVFIGPAPEGMEACHNDGDKHNARFDNLRWDTKQANWRDRASHKPWRQMEKIKESQPVRAHANHHVMDVPTRDFTPLDGEIWHPIPGYDGFYEASSYGRIRSLKREIDTFHNLTKKMIKKTISPRIMKVSVVSSGYQALRLSKNGEKTMFLVHIVVLSSFIQKPSIEHQCNHKDGDKKNNCLTNLEWVTCSENVQHAFKVLGRKSHGHGPSGIRNPKSKSINIEKVLLLHNEGLQQRQIAEEIGATQPTVWRVLHGMHWSQRENSLPPALPQRGQLLGKNHPNSKLPDITLIQQLRNDGSPLKAIAQQTQLGISLIIDVLKGRHWSQRQTSWSR